MMHNIVILIEEEADAATLAELGIDDPRELLGLYRGWPLPEREATPGGCLPDTVHLYARAIEHYAHIHGEPLEQTVRETLIHEIGHYFGFSDAQMEALAHTRDV